MGEKGFEIAMSVKKARKTQRWLLAELNKSGFPNLRESTLSSILTGSYTTGCAAAVIEASEKIIAERRAG